MSPAVRGVVAVILGLLLAFAITFAVEGINARLYPPPPGVDLANPESVKAMMAVMPRAANFWSMNPRYGISSMNPTGRVRAMASEICLARSIVTTG